MTRTAVRRSSITSNDLARPFKFNVTAPKSPARCWKARKKSSLLTSPRRSSTGAWIGGYSSGPGVFELFEARSQVHSKHLKEIRRYRQVACRVLAIKIKELVLNPKVLERQSNAVSLLPLIACPIHIHCPTAVKDVVH